jgi:hypothetical protein
MFFKVPVLCKIADKVVPQLRLETRSERNAVVVVISRTIIGYSLFPKQSKQSMKFIVEEMHRSFDDLHATCGLA